MRIIEVLGCGAHSFLAVTAIRPAYILQLMLVHFSVQVPTKLCQTLFEMWSFCKPQMLNHIRLIRVRRERLDGLAKTGEFVGKAA